MTRDVASLTGLKEGTIVVGGAGDQAAGAIGNGIVKDGVVSSTIGTSGVVFAYTKEPKLIKKVEFILSVMQYQIHGMLWELLKELDCH